MRLLMFSFLKVKPISMKPFTSSRSSSPNSSSSAIFSSLNRGTWCFLILFEPILFDIVISSLPSLLWMLIFSFRWSNKRIKKRTQKHACSACLICFLSRNIALLTRWAELFNIIADGKNEVSWYVITKVLWSCFWIKNQVILCGEACMFGDFGEKWMNII